jgi:hypothetical protein
MINKINIVNLLINNVVTDTNVVTEKPMLKLS